MTGKLVAFVMLLCVTQLAFGDDLAEGKANALKKIDLLRKAVKNAYVQTCDMFHTRPVYLHDIKEKKTQLGQSLRELNMYEINKTAEGAKQKAQLLHTTQKMSDCIQAKKEKALARVEEAFAQGFIKPVADLLGKAREKYQRLTQDWTSEYHDASETLFVQSLTAADEVKSTNNKAYLQTVVAHYETIANDTIKQILSLVEMYKNNELLFDRTLEKGPLNAFRTSGRKIVDEYVETINNCFVAV